MIEKEIIALLKMQLRQSSDREKSLLEQIDRQSAQITRLSYQLEQQSVQLNQQTLQLQQQAADIKSLTATIQSMEKSMQLRESNLQSLMAQNRALRNLMGSKSEKIKVDQKKTTELPQADAVPETDAASETDCGLDKPKQEKPPYNPKDRGNNQAKRKDFFDIETVIEDIYPDDPAFDLKRAKVIGYTDSVLYKFIPGKFIKYISRRYNCLMEEKIYSGKAIEKAPLLNSNYDSSFIAGILQLRFIYSMPVERILDYFAENGFELCKPTAHGLIKKSAFMMERFATVLKKVILEDDYICMDETYYNILTGEKNEQGKGIRKGYIWAALPRHTKLVQFFYENGSRKTEVFTDYVDADYEGAIQSDGLSNYKIIETDAYPDAIFRQAQ
jgi:hypothetical protein